MTPTWTAKTKDLLLCFIVAFNEMAKLAIFLSEVYEKKLQRGIKTADYPFSQ